MVSMGNKSVTSWPTRRDEGKLDRPLKAVAQTMCPDGDCSGPITHPRHPCELRCSKEYAPENKAFKRQDALVLRNVFCLPAK